MGVNHALVLDISLPTPHVYLSIPPTHNNICGTMKCAVG